MNKRIALFTTVLMMITLMPLSVLAADTSPADGYNDNDFDKLQAFLDTPSSEEGVSNGQQINPAYDSDDPTTWTDVEWNSDAEKRITRIGYGGDWDFRQLAGTLDVSDLTALEVLCCAGNDIAALNVSGDTALEAIFCVMNAITSLDVSTNTALKSLYCIDNAITALDVSANSALEWLQCRENPLTSLDLSANTQLKWLDCYDCGLTSLNVSANPALELLDCSENELTMLDVSSNTMLEMFNCSGNPLTALDVSANTALTSLGFNETRLTSVDVSTNTNLHYLEFNRTPLTSLDVSTNTGLMGLSCVETGLTTLDLSANPALMYLYCWGNDLTTLDISANTMLIQLDCSENDLTTLDVSANTMLVLLYCYDNDLSALVMGANTDLAVLDCSDNAITSLNISTNTKLEELNCDNNGLTALDLSTNTILDWIGCRGNALTGLDVSANTVLTRLDCAENDITSLDLSTNTLLRKLVCDNNALTTLDIRANKALVALNCGGNLLTQIDADIKGSEIALRKTGSGTLELFSKNEDMYAKGTPSPNTVFCDWTQGDTQAGTNAQLDLNAGTDYNLMANFGGTVTFDSNGGVTEASPDTVTVKAGNKISLPIPPTKNGYTFDGWYQETACTNVWNFDADTVQNNMTLYAKWTVNDYIVTFDSQSGSAVAAITVAYGSTVDSPTAPTRKGYTFGGWYETSACDGEAVTFPYTVVRDVTLYAKWEAMPAAQLIGIKGTLLDAHGDPLSGYTVELHSTPQTVVTDSAGKYTFLDVTIEGHSLIVKDTTGTTLGTFTLSIVTGDAFAWTNDGKGSIDVTVQNNTAQIDITLEVDNARAVSVEIIENVVNPQTGDWNMTRPILMWLLIGLVGAAAVATSSVFILRRKHSDRNNQTSM